MNKICKAFRALVIVAMCCSFITTSMAVNLGTDSELKTTVHDYGRNDAISEDMINKTQCLGGTKGTKIVVTESGHSYGDVLYAEGRISYISGYVTAAQKHRTTVKLIHKTTKKVKKQAYKEGKGCVEAYKEFKILPDWPYYKSAVYYKAV